MSASASTPDLDEIMGRFHHHISLGYNCSMKFYLDLKRSQPTQYFDYLGSSAWTILSLLEADFAGHVDRAKFERTNPVPGKFLFANTRYNLRFLHDFPPKFRRVPAIPRGVYREFCEKCERRKERFTDILRDHENPILFFRLDEPYVKDRKVYGPITSVYPSSNNLSDEEARKAMADFEYENFVKVCNLLKHKYNRSNFAVIYVSHGRPTQIDLDNNIIVIHHQEEIFWEGAGKVLDELFRQNHDLICYGLTQIMERYGSQNINT